MTSDNCQRWEPLLARAADDALESDDRAALEHHLSACAACRDALAVQRSMRGLLRSRPPMYASAAFTRDVMAMLEHEASWLDRLDFRQWTWRLAPVAAALLVALWAVGPSGDAAATGMENTETVDADAPVSSVLWDESVSDISLLTLMLRAGPDEGLAEALKERQP